MSNLREVDSNGLNLNIFSTFLKDTPLITAGSADRLNTMTIGWGMLGTIWNKNAGTFYVRPCRYTHDFLTANDTFSISILPPRYREVLTLCGTTSGRDTDKISAAGLTVAYDVAPYFEEADRVMILRKMYTDAFKTEGFVGSGCEHYDTYYAPESAQGNLLPHDLFIGEVIKLLEK